MGTLRAQVRGGRLVLDEPTDLPEGTQVELVEADPFSAMDPKQRERMEASIDRGLQQAKAGEVRPLDDVLNEL